MYGDLVSEECDLVITTNALNQPAAIVAQSLVTEGTKSDKIDDVSHGSDHLGTKRKLGQRAKAVITVGTPVSHRARRRRQVWEQIEVQQAGASDGTAKAKAWSLGVSSKSSSRLS